VAATRAEPDGGKSAAANNAVAAGANGAAAGTTESERLFVSL